MEKKLRVLLMGFVMIYGIFVWPGEAAAYGKGIADDSSSLGGSFLHIDTHTRSRSYW